MRVEPTGADLAAVAADLRALILCEGERPPDWVARAPGAGDVRAGLGKRSLVHPKPGRTLVLGGGSAAELDAARIRELAARAAAEAREHGSRTLALAVPGAASLGPEAAARALVEGAILASFRFDRFRASADDGAGPPLEGLLVASAGEDLRPALRSARSAALAANRARELQSLPANVLTPAALAERALELSVAYEPVTVEVLGRDAIRERGLGGLEAVAAGSAQEPQLISIRYAGRGAGQALGLVGKAVTFDSGGISIKPAQGMEEMKMDMSGGAAVIEAVAAIAELGLGLDVVATVPATENMPSGSALRPGDVITQLNGKTVEVVNTDAEGRLILADALTWCVRELGAARLVDVATLTGAVLVALGSTYSALLADDDEWAASVLRAAECSGELVWRLPLHREYRELTRGTITDLRNAAAKRRAGTIFAAEFLAQFTEGVPWAHLDIAGTAWDVGREPFGDGPTGAGTRLLVALADDLAGNSPPTGE